MCSAYTNGLSLSVQVGQPGKETSWWPIHAPINPTDPAFIATLFSMQSIHNDIYFTKSLA